MRFCCVGNPGSRLPIAMIAARKFSEMTFHGAIMPYSFPFLQWGCSFWCCLAWRSSCPSGQCAGRKINRLWKKCERWNKHIGSAGRRVLPRFLSLLLYFGSLLTSITVSDIFITVTVIRRQVLCETMRKAVRSQR